MTGPGPKAGTVNCTMAAVPEYRDWLHGFAESRDLEVAQLIEQALRGHAAREGHPPPPRRLPRRPRGARRS